MKNNKMKERAYQEFKNKHKIGLITIPIMVIFVILIMIIMIIMASNGVTDRKTYLLFTIAITSGIIGFFLSLHAVRKSKAEDDNQE